MTLLTVFQRLTDIASQFRHFPGIQRVLPAVGVQILQKLHTDIDLPSDGVLPLPHVKIFNIYYISGRFQGLQRPDFIHHSFGNGLIIGLNRLAGHSVAYHFSDFSLFPGYLNYLYRTVKGFSLNLPLRLIYFTIGSPADQLHCMPGRPYLTDSVHLLIPVLCLLLSNSG